MDIPEHLWRFPTKASIDRLSRRLCLPNTPGMQDWEIEVSDPERITEFIRTYEDESLDDDKRFTVMVTIIQSFEESIRLIEADPEWLHVLSLIERDIMLHRFSVWSWADPENAIKDSWRVASSMRNILEKHRTIFEIG